METTKFILIGGGQHAHVVLDSLFSAGADVVALFDNTHRDGDIFGVPHRGGYTPSFEPDAAAIIAIGSNTIRRNVAGTIGHAFGNTIHASVIFSNYASLGTGNMILHGSIVQANAKIGSHVIINTGAQVDHDCVIEDYAHIAPRVTLCGNVHVGEGALIGAGAIVIPGRKIGAWAVVGAGSVVINDVPDGARVVGNPARAIVPEKI
jgi:sugar O-acyltransferase (sialic acid O-acetyltransferase NeuD family)